MQPFDLRTEIRRQHTQRRRARLLGAIAGQVFRAPHHLFQSGAEIGQLLAEPCGAPGAESGQLVGRFRPVRAVLIDDHPQARRRQEAVDVKSRRCHGFEHEDRFQQQNGRSRCLTDGEAGVAGLGVEQESHRVQHQGMVHAAELEVLAQQGGLSIEGEGHVAAGEGGKTHRGQAILFEAIGSRTELIGDHLEVLEQANEEVVACSVGVVSMDLRQQGVGDIAPKRRHLQESVAATFHSFFEFFRGSGGLLDQAFQLVDGSLLAVAGVPQGGERADAVAEPLQQQLGRGDRPAESPHTFMVPAGENLLAGAPHVGHVDQHVAVLPDAIDAADALLDQVWIYWQVEHDEVPRVLEVPPFTADLRADEHTGTLGFHEPRGVAVPLHQLDLLVEQRDVGAQPAFEFVLDGAGRRCRAACHEDFLGGRVSEERFQVSNARIVVQELRAVSDAGVRRIERSQHDIARWEIAQDRALVVEDDAARAVPVDQVGEEFGARLGFTDPLRDIVDLQSQDHSQSSDLLTRQLLARSECGSQACSLLVS